MVNQVIDLSGGNSQEYSEFLGLQNTKLGQWFNRTFPTKKKYDEAVAKANLLDFQNSVPYNPNVNTAPGGGMEDDVVKTPAATWEVIGKPQYQYEDVGTGAGAGNNMNNGNSNSAAVAAESESLSASDFGNVKKSNSWMWIVAGVAVTAGVVAFVINKRNNKKIV